LTKAQKEQICFSGFCVFVSWWSFGSLLEFAVFYLIMRHFAAQKLATGNYDRESKLLS